MSESNTFAPFPHLCYLTYYNIQSESKDSSWKGAVHITPYELYLKFLYEYFRDDLKQAEEVFYKYVPKDFMKLEYQEQTVLNVKKILQEYGGVFIFDVVGLGKTYISALRAQQLDGRHLVIAHSHAALTSLFICWANFW